MTTHRRRWQYLKSPKLSELKLFLVTLIFQKTKYRPFTMSSLIRRDLLLPVQQMMGKCQHITHLYSVIKLWDRDTLTLQASLHAHFDYITWIIISNCNKYIVSAGNDAQIIVWELATGKLVQRLTHHTKLINVIKFFCPRSSQIALDTSQH